jgi:hypothetical protein
MRIRWRKLFAGRMSMLRYDQSRVVEAIVKVYERVIRERFGDARQPTTSQIPENHYTQD